MVAVGVAAFERFVRQAADLDDHGQDVATALQGWFERMRPWAAAR